MDNIKAFSQRFRSLFKEQNYKSISAFLREYNERYPHESFTHKVFLQYQNAEATPSIDRLHNLCNMWHVSSDYLLGLSEKKEYKDVQYISETIGLSEKSINILRKFLHKTSDFNPLDIVLSSTSGLGFLFKLYGFLISSDLFEGLKRKEFEFENDITLQFSAIDFKNMFIFEVLKKLEFSEFEYRQQKEKEGKQNGGNKKKKE